MDVDKAEGALAVDDGARLSVGALPNEEVGALGLDEEPGVRDLADEKADGAASLSRRRVMGDVFDICVMTVFRRKRAFV